MRLSGLPPALALLALLAACAGCIADPTAETSTPATRQAGVPLIAPEALASFVPPAPPGWHLLGPPAPVLIEEGGAPLVSVSGSYLSDDGKDRGADLTIQDTDGRSVGLRRLVDGLRATQGNGTAPEPTTLRGRSAFVLNDGSVTTAYIVVADRYVVWLAVTGGTGTDLEAFVAALDFDGLAGLR